MTQRESRFRDLHHTLIMINDADWRDSGSANLMASLGAKALATSSAAHAHTLGKPDGGTITRDDALAHAQEIAAATSLPVQGDIENGFGDAPETCAETVRLAAEIGLAGICIEDTVVPTRASYPIELAIERIRAAAARDLPSDFIRPWRRPFQQTLGPCMAPSGVVTSPARRQGPAQAR